jgi:hypothetical protein
LIDVKQALSIPEVYHIVAKRDEVVGRFGPLFRNPSALSKQDYREFLSFQHNHHWTGLERLGRLAADDMDNLRDALTTLVDETLPLSERFDTASTKLHGVSAGIGSRAIH